MVDIKTASRTLQVDVGRGDESGTYVRYEVLRRDRQTILDVVTCVQRHAEPELAYRFACRVGMCGSCAMAVDDRFTGCLWLLPRGAHAHRTAQRRELVRRNNATVNAGRAKLYEGLSPPALRRFGETDDRSEELI